MTTRYIESVENDAGDVFDVFRVAVPRASTVALAALDLSSGTQPSATDSRAIARPVAEEAQAAVADGRLVLP